MAGQSYVDPLSEIDGFPTLPTVGIKNQMQEKFECFWVNMQDVRRFHLGFYKTSNKIYQDNFILRHVKGKQPKRH